MAQNKHTFLPVITLFCLALGGMVMLHGLHVNDLAKLHSPTQSALLTKTGDELIKVSGELHHHIDKQTLKSLTHANDMQVDSRSLRLLKQDIGRHLRVSTLERWLVLGLFWLAFYHVRQKTAAHLLHTKLSFK